MMPLIGGDALYRLTDYLDKQAVREKEKRTEKFLTVLPTYLQKQISEITDEKTLFSTIPKLSAQMYAFGPQVGQAANQILGNLADVKYKEISFGKQQKQTESAIKIYGEIAGQNPGSSEAFTGLLGKINTGEIDAETFSKLAPTVIQSSATKETGLGIDEGGKYFYQSYTVGPKGTKPGERYELKKGKTGYGMDKTSTTDVEELPLTMEAMEYLEKRLTFKQDLDARLNKELAYRIAGINIAEEKETKKLQNWASKQLYYDKSDTSANNQVFLEFNKDGIPSFYKKGKEQIVTSIGKTPFYEDKKIPVTNLSNIERVTQTPTEKTDNITSSDIRLETEKANLYARNIGQAMIAAGDATDADLRDPNTGYFKIDKLLEVAEKYPEKYADVKANIIQLNLQGAGTLTNDKPITVQKPKW